MHSIITVARYFLTVFLLFAFVQLHAQSIGRASFNSNWKFKLDSVQSYIDPGMNDAAWRSLQLPHDWSIEGKFDKNNPATVGGGALPGGTGWYRKTFLVPVIDSAKSIRIVFDGVYCNSEVWINGQYLGFRPNGYISFSYNLTPYLHYGDQANVIAVKVDNSKQPNSRWYSGSGIYRNVWLVKTHPLHIAENGTFVSTPVVNHERANVQIQSTIYNEFNKDKNVVVETTILDATGQKIETGIASMVVKANMHQDLSQTLLVIEPALWTIEKPVLYTALSKLLVDDVVVEEYKTSFGIRYFNFDADKGFFLNGKSLKILGVCNHHDLGCLGAAINKRALQRQLEILKAMGCNGIRTSHNPPAPELLDLCDEMGFIVMDEAFDMWERAKSKYDYAADFPQWHTRDLQDQIRRDRNHTSVFVWSVGNEILEQWDLNSNGAGNKNDTSGRRLAKELVNTVLQMDNTRPVVTANNEPEPYNNLIASGAFDLIGINYHHEFWPGFRKVYPGKKLIITESVSALETRGAYDLVPADSIRRWPTSWNKPLQDGNKDHTVSAYDHVSTPWGSTHEETWRLLKKYDHISGMYTWTGWDYIGEPTPYDWPSRSSYFGIIDLAGFPKDVYYMYQSEWTSKSVLHLLPHWNWNKGDTVDVVAYYNNADEVELYLNGRSLGKREKLADTFHVKWRVPYMPGTLNAVSRKDSKPVLVTQVHTAGTPAKLQLIADRSQLKADGNDLSFITVNILDAKGNIVPNAGNHIEFDVSGAGFVAGVDNGSQTSMETFKASERNAFNGKCLVVIRSSGEQGAITVTAKGNGLEVATVELFAK